MAKTFRHLWPQVIAFENLWQAYYQARRGKRYTEPAAYFDLRAEDNILQLQRELADGTYRPGRYQHFYITEPKPRKISAAPFRDRVVHHALVNVLEPIYEARFSEASFACRKGKGTHAAMERAHWGIRNCRHYLKGDIVKFFPSVDHAVLKALLFRKVADRQVQRLIERLIDSGVGVLADECPPQWFAGDDLLTPGIRPKGLPIGNLTSQFFANVLLNELDQFVQRQIQPRRYVRYADDFLLFDNDRRKLAAALPVLREFLAGLRLQAHPRKTVIQPCAQGVKFVGFRLLPATRRIDRASISRFRRRMRHWRALRQRGAVEVSRITASARGWLAHAAHANTHALVREVLQDVAA